MAAIVHKLIELARGGELPAIVETLNRSVGKSPNFVDVAVLDRLDEVERRLDEALNR